MSDFVCPEGAALVPLIGKYGTGKFAIVDEDDYAKVSGFRWYLDPKGYVYSRPTGHPCAVPLHRFLMSPPLGVPVDHANRDRLDNRRANLRLCTHTENACNREKQPGGSSLFKGVSRAQTKKGQHDFQARISFEKRYYYLGYYPDEIAAAEAYDAAARYLFGEFAWTNFPGKLALSPEEIRAKARSDRTPVNGGATFIPSRDAWRVDILGIYVGQFSSKEIALEAVRIAWLM